MKFKNRYQMLDCICALKCLKTIGITRQMINTPKNLNKKNKQFHNRNNKEKEISHMTK